MDEKMLQKAQKILSENEESKIQILEFTLASYADINHILGDRKADYILIDIGVNLEHFKDPSRGFSIKSNADLDMRYNQNATKSASTIINSYSLQELSKIFQEYGDFAEKKADELAQAICKERKHSPIQDTFGLKTILNSCGLGEKAAAVIFQAIRVETNDELENLKKFLEVFPDCLTSG
ncbi:16S rRNA (cytosine(1402)-N(4))-methyltransferase [Patescibacteria group bacterium]|nr:16S rRNA (cytosine(1402)-N(4))-methyltransferase [Patescibacteria group bacterium]MBU1757587.1 16S rRNA (cytosine(1402)-N(4))-methyltransferase [Patescibacteria group bacterium]